MLHRKCHKCGTEIKTWVSYIDITLGLIILGAIMLLASVGHYTRDTIHINPCEQTIDAINWETLPNPISIKEACKDDKCDSEKIYEIANKQIKENAREMES